VRFCGEVVVPVFLVVSLSRRGEGEGEKVRLYMRTCAVVDGRDVSHFLIMSRIHGVSPVIST
jgi:hypothetical protein